MANDNRWLTALPVFNEINFLDDVLDEVLECTEHVLVVDDGSSDGTTERLQERRQAQPNRLFVVHHAVNRGYGAALRSAFAYTQQFGYAGLVTLDCDGQHQPHRIPRFIEAAGCADIVSGSRYLKQYEGDDAPPAERLFINRRITADINRLLGLNLTDAFCGFKAYRTTALGQLHITDNGYAMPLQLWAEAAAAGLSVMELPVPLIYLDLERSFGGSLDHAETRLNHYHTVLQGAIDAITSEGRWNPEWDDRHRPCAGA
ncbi:MAG: glycosyltransferase family 2 protein [Planctomycetota bacterium]